MSFGRTAGMANDNVIVGVTRDMPQDQLLHFNESVTEKMKPARCSARFKNGSVIVLELRRGFKQRHEFITNPFYGG